MLLPDACGPKLYSKLIYKPCEGNTEHPLGPDVSHDPAMDLLFTQYVCNLL